MRIALDSNVFIASLSPAEPSSPHAQKLIRDIAGGLHSAIASSLIYGEVLDMSSDKHLDVGGFVARINHLQTVAADDTVCVEAGRLRQKHGPALKLPDALHLATAVQHGAGLFITDDVALAKIARKLLPVKTLAEL